MAFKFELNQRVSTRTGQHGEIIGRGYVRGSVVYVFRILDGLVDLDLSQEGVVPVHEGALYPEVAQTALTLKGTIEWTGAIRQVEKGELFQWPKGDFAIWDSDERSGGDYRIFRFVEGYGEA